MNLTIYSDISADPGSDAAAAAFWLRSERGCIIDCVDIPLEYQTSTNAMECYAILVAFKAAFKAWGKTIDTVFLRSDNTTALNSLTHGAGIFDPGLAKASAEVRAGIARHELRVLPAHVRGHQNPSASKQSYINNAVDAISRERMRALRDGKHDPVTLTQFQSLYDSRFKTRGKSSGCLDAAGKLTSAGIARVRERMRQQEESLGISNRS
jgi:ribonuclease HI